MTAATLYLYLLAFALTAALFFLFHWWINRKSVQAEETRKARKMRAFEEDERDLEYRRELARESRYLYATRFGFVLARVIEPLPGDAIPADREDDESVERDGLDEEADAAIDAALGPPKSSQQHRPQKPKRPTIGPEFERHAANELSGQCLHQFVILEVRTGSKLTANNSGSWKEDHWVFSVRLPKFATYRDLPEPVAFSSDEADWWTTVPFAEIPRDQVEQALDALEAWFMRVITGGEVASGGRLTKSADRSELFVQFPGYPGCL